MADINCYVTTFNCARKLIDVDYFAANLLNGFKGATPPELIVLCLQEIAPLGYSFLGGSLLAPYYARFAEAVNGAASHKFGRTSKYNVLAARNLGMTSIMVCALHEHESGQRIRLMETAGIGVGLWEMGNKGAVGVRLGVSADAASEETVLTFVAAHLAPMEDAWRRRNEDWRNVCEGLVFEKESKIARVRAPTSDRPESEPLLSDDGAEGRSESSLFSPASHVYFAGDLNYRTSDTFPKPDDHLNWPQPVESTADSRHHSHWLERDQLSRERNKGNTLHLLDEASVNFPPTYKYSSAAQRHVASATDSTARRLADGRVNDTTYIKAVDDDVWLWAKHRAPSWCDRILYLAAAPPTIQDYTALPLQPTSDHRPVAMSFSIAARPVEAAIDPPFQVRKDWRERRATARRSEVIVGFGAYLSMTWDGRALLAGTIVGIIGGYLVLRALLQT